MCLRDQKEYVLYAETSDTVILYCALVITQGLAFKKLSWTIQRGTIIGKSLNSPFEELPSKLPIR